MVLEVNSNRGRDGKNSSTGREKNERDQNLSQRNTDVLTQDDIINVTIFELLHPLMSHKTLQTYYAYVYISDIYAVHIIAIAKMRNDALTQYT